MAKKIHNKTIIKESHYYLKKIEKNVNAEHAAEIEAGINEIKKIKHNANLSELKKYFKKIYSIIDQMYDSDSKEIEIKRIKDFNNEIKISKVKDTISKLGKNFSRLHVKEIAEESEINDEKFIIHIISEMISKGEINARFFESTSSVAFNQDANIQDMPILKDMTVSGSITQIKEKCIVCKGDIQHLIYQCPKCQAIYHVKCAIFLRKDKKNCFQCNEPIPFLPE